MPSSTSTTSDHISGGLEAAVIEGLDPADGEELMDALAGIARQLAVDAINQAIASGGDEVKIATAEQALDDGDELRTAGAYKDAVNEYKDALAEAEGALP